LQVATQDRAFTRFAQYWLPVLAYVAVIFGLSAQPNLVVPLHFPNADKVAHLLEYSVLGILTVRALRSTRWLAGALAGGLVALSLGMLVGASDETFQRLIPGRESSALDFLADTVGLTLAQVLYLAVRRG